MDVHAKGKLSDRDFFQHAQSPGCVGTAGNGQAKKADGQLPDEASRVQELPIDMISPH
ncbi:hypothetical protein ALQ89_100297 [Pseudomonas amygdali pv. tabaci]|uniref:Uncharacterized protein n=2 Tax=Pseudomonas amygdali TaxID=47877 RepID=A0A0N8T2R5_PSEAJ|nr:hypothetical protein ALO35_101595 [Pseudomonas amygdali pv. lachrymans]KPY83528.1 hypothetical protein ALO60_101231 [Pseudomonas amygdali pv. tabaci]RML83325.1 hypothetical protein ALQ89_100297 [Pseudomonas amygdali pv. tabaci]RMR79030.1 hypothetical protein ALP77_101145 [Pseudomonas amygdali pv. tabaci]RMW04012.1 hypothetical protein ALP03_101570 [Pseudomonas amygdali pv. tabaci]